MQDTPIIDFDFTLSQLSGNKELALKMLNRFEDEYNDADKRIGAFLQSQDYTPAKQLVHTLKGVAGNLGIKALHLASKRLEDSIRDQQDIELEFAMFKQFLAETLTEVDKLNKGSAKDGENSQTSGSQQNRKALLGFLERSEFIPTDKLEALLSEIEISDADKRSLKTAIEELDYDQALSLLTHV